MFGNGHLHTKLASDKLTTLIGPDTYVQGVIRTKGSVRIEGRLEGNITDAQNVIVAETGQIQGDVNAQGVVIGGRVKGNIAATKSIEILARGQVIGDIRAPQLNIENGAVFEGGCFMSQEKTHEKESSRKELESLPK